MKKKLFLFSFFFFWFFLIFFFLISIFISDFIFYNLFLLYLNMGKKRRNNNKADRDDYAFAPMRQQSSQQSSRFGFVFFI